MTSTVRVSRELQPEEHVAEVNPPQTYSSRDLFQDKTEIRIQHEGEIYRLRITRSGGLLLNK